ncbi:MAG: CotH kinase family protein [Planctomycetota bacterium]
MFRLPLMLLIAALALTATSSAQYASPLDDAAYLDAQQNVFLPDEITYVTVTMAPGDLNYLLNNRDTDQYADCTVNIVNSQINETYANCGIRPRGNSGRDAKKNPWKISFHEFVPGRRFHGLKKMNLGGDAPDPTISRSSAMFKMLREFGVPASRTHHVWLEINDGSQVSGLFVHLENVDDIFVKAWFGNDDGRLYKCRIRDEPANLTFRPPGNPAAYGNLDAYEEKTYDGDFLLLAEFINFINNTTDQEFADEIGDWLNVDGFLRAQAADMICGQWDGLWIGGNNYYLYENTGTGRLEYIPWDLDHAFGTDYLFFPIIGSFGTNFATKPYNGWGNGGFGMNGNAPPPLIERLLEVPNYDNGLKHYAHAFNNGPFHPAQSFPFIDGVSALTSPLAFTGSFSGSSMDNRYDNADHIAGFASPANYQAFTNPATWGLKPFIESRRAYVAANYPKPNALPRVYLNEVMADNATTLADELGDFEDWVELYNDEEIDVDLTGWSLSDRPGEAGRWTFPAGTIIPAKSHLLVWCDDDVTDGPLHTDFKLSAGGESVHLWAAESLGAIQAAALLFPALAADQSFGRSPDASPNLEILTTATPGALNDTGSFAVAAYGNCPGPMELVAFNATPQTQVIVLAALGNGTFPIPAGFPCAGTVLDLDPLTITPVGIGISDLHGTLRLDVILPDAVCGAVVVQALDTANCGLTATINL